MSSRCLEMTAAGSIRRQGFDLLDQCVHYLRYDILTGREALNEAKNICGQEIELGLRRQITERLSGRRGRSAAAHGGEPRGAGRFLLRGADGLGCTNPMICMNTYVAT